MSTARPDPRSPRRAAFALLALAWLPSCVSDRGSQQIFTDFAELSSARRDDAWWQARSGRSASRGNSLLPIPMWLDEQRVEFSGDEHLASRWDMAVAGFALFPQLQVWMSVDLEVQRGDGRSSRSSLTWTPFFATGSTDGEPPGEGLDGWGVPLVYGGFSGRTDDFDIACHQVLWLLGPMTVAGWAATDDGRAEGWAFAPAYLGGLGLLLWTSLHVDLEDEGTVTAVRAHGPLAGLLGYFSIDSGDGSGFRESRTTLLGGLLWYSSRSAEDTSARHGPLWGMFGWGRRNGEPCLLLLWVPILI